MDPITCPECSSQVTAATTCPECGCPIPSITAPSCMATMSQADALSSEQSAKPQGSPPPRKQAFPPYNQHGDRPSLAKKGVFGSSNTVKIVGAYALIGGCVVAYVAMNSPTTPRPSDNVASGITQTTKSNDGTDSRRPMLAPEDEGFVDIRRGWNWSSRCYTNIQRGQWGWAKAECDKGMTMTPPPETHAILLFNEGLIARAAGDPSEARNDFNLSLEVRENATVRAARDAL